MRKRIQSLIVFFLLSVGVFAQTEAELQDFLYYEAAYQNQQVATIRCSKKEPLNVGNILKVLSLNDKDSCTRLSVLRNDKLKTLASANKIWQFDVARLFLKGKAKDALLTVEFKNGLEVVFFVQPHSLTTAPKFRVQILRFAEDYSYGCASFLMAYDLKTTKKLLPKYEQILATAIEKQNNNERPSLDEQRLLDGMYEFPLSPMRETFSQAKEYLNENRFFDAFLTLLPLRTYFYKETQIYYDNNEYPFTLSDVLYEMSKATAAMDWTFSADYYANIAHVLVPDNDELRTHSEQMHQIALKKYPQFPLTEQTLFGEVLRDMHVLPHNITGKTAQVLYSNAKKSLAFIDDIYNTPIDISQPQTVLVPISFNKHPNDKSILSEDTKILFHIRPVDEERAVMYCVQAHIPNIDYNFYLTNGNSPMNIKSILLSRTPVPQNQFALDEFQEVINKLEAENRMYELSRVCNFLITSIKNMPEVRSSFLAVNYFAGAAYASDSFAERASFNHLTAIEEDNLRYYQFYVKYLADALDPRAINVIDSLLLKLNPEEQLFFHQAKVHVLLQKNLQEIATEYLKSLLEDPYAAEFAEEKLKEISK